MEDEVSEILQDSFGRTIEYLRLSVTEQCDLRCFYCRPGGQLQRPEDEALLTFDELERLVRAFAELGTRRVRITGGEPLLRHDLPRLAERLAALPGLEDLSLSTNGVQLARHAEALRRAGVTRLNVSLDTLRPERFETITGGGHLERVLSGLEAARAAGFAPIKINMVAMAGINDDEFEEMLEFCARQGFTLRLIETMPVGESGRRAGSHYLDLQAVRAQLERAYRLVPDVMPGGGPARYYRLDGSDLRIGFITPLSQHFCATCNRVRLAADGTLHLCLGDEDQYAFRPLLRAGAGVEELKAHIRRAIARKPERHHFSEEPGRVVRSMVQTGG